MCRGLREPIRSLPGRASAGFAAPHVGVHHVCLCQLVPLLNSRQKSKPLSHEAFYIIHICFIPRPPFAQPVDPNRPIRVRVAFNISAPWEAGTTKGYYPMEEGPVPKTRVPLRVQVFCRFPSIWEKPVFLFCLSSDGSLHVPKRLPFFAFVGFGQVPPSRSSSSLCKKSGRHTVDGQNPAPPKRPWHDDSPVNINIINKQWFPISPKWCRISSVHSIFFFPGVFRLQGARNRSRPMALTHLRNSRAKPSLALRREPGKILSRWFL